MYHTHPYYKRLFFKDRKAPKQRMVFANAEEKRAYFSKKYNFAQFARKARAISMIELLYEIPVNSIIKKNESKGRTRHINRQLAVAMSKILMDFFGMVFRDITNKEIVEISSAVFFAIESAPITLEKQLKGFKRESYLQNDGKIYLPSFSYTHTKIRKINEVNFKEIANHYRTAKKVFAVPFNYQYQRLLQTQKYYTNLTIL